MRSGAMIAGAAPAHSGDEADGHRLRVLDRASPTPCSCKPGAAVAADGAVDLDHALVPVAPSSSARATATVPPVIFRTSPGRAPMRVEIGRRQPRDGVADVFDARFGDAERHGGRQRASASDSDAR